MGTGHPAAVVLRRFRAADAPALSALVSRAVRACHAGLYAPRVLERIESDLAPRALLRLSETRVIVVAETQREIIGTGALEGQWLQALFVDPARQRRGVGARLVNHLEDIAVRGGRHRLHLYSTLNAVSFYQGRGYQDIGQLENEDYGTVIAMSKPLLGPD